MTEKITVKDAALVLGYHPNHVYRLLRDGTLKGERFNRVWMVDRLDVARLKSEQNDNGRLPRGYK